jgi:uncharacterized membrane protein
MKTTDFSPHKSSLGLDANLLVMIVYILAAGFVWIPFVGYAGWLLPLILFFLEKESKFVKFAAAQSLIVGIAMAAVTIVRDFLVWVVEPKSASDAIDQLGDRSFELILSGDLESILSTGRTTSMNIVYWIFSAINLCAVIAVLYVLFMGLQYKQVELPFVAPFAHKLSAKLDTVDVNIDIKKKPAQDSACPFCGAMNPEGTKFCGSCGKAL